MILVTNKKPLPKDQPTAKTERRVKLNTTPEALFAALTSKDRTRMTEAATALGWEWLAGRIYGDIALHAVNLDADDATERILTLENAAAVLKQEGDEWWLVGSFSCCGPSGRAAEPFVEWKSLVWRFTRTSLSTPAARRITRSTASSAATGIWSSKSTKTPITGAKPSTPK
jgi:hypothetical protein